MTDNYQEYVQHLEEGYAPYAKFSFEPFSQVFVNGGEIYRHYNDLWNGKEKARLLSRTPLQRERDRIIYSDGMRRLTEKYHILYRGQERIVRNYTTHSVRMAQVTRSISRGLRLNTDFAEAIALGAKLGATPFVHAAKNVISQFVTDTVFKLDNEGTGVKRGGSGPQLRFGFDADFNDFPLPSWIDSLKTESVYNDVIRFIPWSAGISNDPAYSSGRESYWLLLTNPFTRESRAATYCPETMYGIWRHTRGLPIGPNSFRHKMSVMNATHKIYAEHITYEAIVNQYADDITWAIENLNDANRAALLGGRVTPDGQNTLFNDLAQHLRHECGGGDISSLTNALHAHDTGSLYTYFIVDFVENSTNILNGLSDNGRNREQLRSGDKCALIGLSPAGEAALTQIIHFLNAHVFSEARVKNRKQMLETVSRACVSLLYEDDKYFLQKRITQKRFLEGWSPAMEKTAVSLLDNSTHRLQLAVDVFADMSDQEIYDFVGIQAL